MEISFPFNFTTSLVLLISFILLILINHQLKKPQKLSKKTKLPPGPPKIPVIGHLHHLIGALPHHSLANLANKYGPLMHLKLGEISVIVVSSPKLAQHVLKTVDPACADRPGSLATKILWYNDINIAFSPYGEYWKQMRKICILEMLNAKSVRLFEYIRKDEVSRLVESIRARTGRPINLTEESSMLSSAITCRAAFGKALKGREELILVVKKGVELAHGFDLLDLFPSLEILSIFNWNKYKLLRMWRKLDSVLNRLIEDHRAINGELEDEDVVDVLLRLQQTGGFEFPIADKNIKAILFDMFSGGTETSSTTLNWAMAELMKNPHILAKAQAEVREAFGGKGKRTIEEGDVGGLKYLKLVIKETLRLHPPIPLIPRVCREECEVDGYTVPLKAKVMVNNWAMGRDPNYWHEPEKYIPERFEDNSIDYLGASYQYLPFGSGRRICPGIGFGLANVELPLAQLLYHFDWALPTGLMPSDLDMEETQGVAVGRKQHLILIPTPHNIN